MIRHDTQQPITYRGIRMTLLIKLHHWLLPKDEDIGYSAYANLVFLSLFFGNLYFQPAYGKDLSIIIVGLILFIVSYFRSYWVEENEISLYLVVFCLIGMVLSEINLGASIFFVYAASACSHFNNRKKAFAALLVVLLVTVAYSLLTAKSSYFWIPAIFISMAFGFVNIHRAEVLAKNKALNQSQQEIKQLAKIAERERISRDLHDLLGHSLSVITLKSELAAKMLQKGMPSADVLSEVEAVEQLSRDTLAQVRGAVKGYNTATIAGELIQAKVATQAADIRLIENIQVDELAYGIESELALIIREAVTNVIRHAQTQKVWISLVQVEEHLKLTINDQGKMTTNKEHSGIQNMRSRIKSLGGTMTIDKIPYTQLNFEVPTVANS